MNNYYCFIAGLPDLNIEDERITYTVKGFKEEFEGILSKKDKQLIDLFYLRYDNANLLRILQSQNFFDERGIYSKDSLDDLVQLVKEMEDWTDNRFPNYFPRFIQAYQQNKPIWENLSWEDQLSAIYYQYAAQCKNRFLVQWFEFNLNLNNIMAASICKKYNLNTETTIIGTSEISKNIRQSGQRDMGLSGTLGYLETILRIAEDSNLQEREQQLDILRWEWLDEQSFFNYFTVERIFSYLVKLEIIERWTSLNPESGQQLFRKIINTLKEEINTENYKI